MKNFSKNFLVLLILLTNLKLTNSFGGMLSGLAGGGAPSLEGLAGGGSNPLSSLTGGQEMQAMEAADNPVDSQETPLELSNEGAQLENEALATGMENSDDQMMNTEGNPEGDGNFDVGRL